MESTGIYYKRKTVKNNVDFEIGHFNNSKETVLFLTHYTNDKEYKQRIYLNEKDVLKIKKFLGADNSSPGYDFKGMKINLDNLFLTKRVSAELNQEQIFEELKTNYDYWGENRIFEMKDFCKRNQIAWLLMPLNKIKTSKSFKISTPITTQKEIVNLEHIEFENVYNEYGHLEIKKDSGKFIINVNGYNENGEEISEELYNLLKKELKHKID